MRTMQVAKILDPYSVALNHGSDDGVEVGQIFTICCRDIIDPETGENLGRYSKLRVKVTDVYPRFAVAETYRILTAFDPEQRAVVEIGDPATIYRPKRRS